MLKTVYDIIGKLEAELWLYVLVGVIALVFLVGVVLELITGDTVQFKKCAKLFIKNPDARNATATASKMPIKVRKAFKRAGKTGEKPSDVINVDTCINSPYAMSIGAKVTKAVLFVTVVLTIISVFIAWIAKVPEGEGVLDHDSAAYVVPVVVGFVGLILAALSGLISQLHYNSLLKVYYDYVDKLDALSKGGNFDGDIVAPSDMRVRGHEPVQEDSVVVIEDDSDMGNDRFRTFEAPTRLDIAVEEDDNSTTTTIVTETVTVTEEVMDRNDSFARSIKDEIDEEARLEREAEERRREEARQEAIEKAKAAAEERRKVAESMASEPVVVAAPAPKVEPVSAGGGSAEALIAKIDGLIKDGAPLPALKEAALQLQQERAKPENKTPELQKRLMETQSAILRAMSSSMRK